MNSGSIKIIIGASADRSTEAVFAGLEKRAQKCGQNINKSFSGVGTGSGGSSGMGKGFNDAAAAARKAERDIEREIANQVKATKAAVREMSREHDKGAKDQIKSEREASREHDKAERDRVRAVKAAEREISNEHKQAARDYARTKREQEKADRIANKPSRFARHMGMYATNNLLPGSLNAFGMASRVGGDLLRGAGVDMSVSGLVSKAVQMQTGSMYLANQERIATGSTRGAKGWNDLSRGVASDLSISTDSVQELITGLTNKTGNFRGAAAMSKDLASIGLASGANMHDMGGSAGAVFNQLKLDKGMTDEKAAALTSQVMRNIVGQTAVGAIDMPDYVVQMARIAAGAHKFAGNTADNIRQQSALAQISVEAGGATNAAWGARSITAFDNTFGKEARRKQFAAQGVELYTVSDEEHRKTGKAQDTLRPVLDIIHDSFKATNGDIPTLSRMFADTLGRAPVLAFGSAYKGAGGGDKGQAAIQAMFDKYMKVTLTKETEDQNVKDYQDSTAAKAVRFQNELEKIASISADTVFPALEKLAPAALSAADSFGKFASFAADNPIGGALSLVAASIANAGLQAGVRSGFELLIKEAGGAALGVGALGVAALAAAAYMEADTNAKDKQDREDSIRDGQAGVYESNIRNKFNKTGHVDAKDQETLELINKNLESRVAAVGRLKRGEMGAYSPNDSEYQLGFERAFQPDKLAARNDAAHDASLINELESNRMLLQAIKDGVLLVKITNPADISAAVGPKVFALGRQLDSGNLPAYLHR